MRYQASEKLEIIRLVEQSSLPVRRTLSQLSIRKSTFYGWYRRYVEGGLDALKDQAPQPARVWNKVPEQTSAAIIELALTEPALSPRELAVKYTDTAQYHVSESTVYRLLKAQDLITSPAFIVMQAADKFSHPTTRVNELWQTDFTYLKVIRWAGSIYPRCSMTTQGSSYPGACVRAWPRAMCRRPWKMHCRLPRLSRTR